jgi:hypothetical protein
MLAAHGKDVGSGQRGVNVSSTVHRRTATDELFARVSGFANYAAIPSNFTLQPFAKPRTGTILNAQCAVLNAQCVMPNGVSSGQWRCPMRLRPTARHDARALVLPGA